MNYMHAPSGQSPAGARVRWRDGVYKPEARAGEPSHFSLLHFPLPLWSGLERPFLPSAPAASLSLLFLLQQLHS